MQRDVARGPDAASSGCISAERDVAARGHRYVATTHEAGGLADARAGDRSTVQRNVPVSANRNNSALRRRRTGAGAERRSPVGHSSAVQRDVAVDCEPQVRHRVRKATDTRASRTASSRVSSLGQIAVDRNVLTRRVDHRKVVAATASAEQLHCAEREGLRADIGSNSGKIAFVDGPVLRSAACAAREADAGGARDRLGAERRLYLRHIVAAYRAAG